MSCNHSWSTKTRSCGCDGGRQYCSSCSGTGRKGYYGNSNDKCSSCSGSGYQRCYICGGSGELNDGMECSRCGATS